MVELSVEQQPGSSQQGWPASNTCELYPRLSKSQTHVQVALLTWWLRWSGPGYIYIFFSKHARRVCCMMDQSQAGGGGEGCSQTAPGVYVKKSVTHVSCFGENRGSTNRGHRAVVCPELGYWDWEPSSSIDRESAVGSYGLKQGYQQGTKKQERRWALSKKPQANSVPLCYSHYNYNCTCFTTCYYHSGASKGDPLGITT